MTTSPVGLNPSIRTNTIKYAVALGLKERRSGAQAVDRQVDLAQAAAGGEVQRYLDTIDAVAAALRRPAAALRAANHNVK
jgi:hypothetical protein